jgi:(2Fe-2S) ferredoxin
MAVGYGRCFDEAERTVAKHDHRSPWVRQVQAEDVPEIIEEHFENGRVVGRLALIELDPTEQ